MSSSSNLSHREVPRTGQYQKRLAGMKCVLITIEPTRVKAPWGSRLGAELGYRRLVTGFLSITGWFEL